MADQLLKENKADEATQQARLAALRGRKCLWLTASCVPGMGESMKQSYHWVIEQGVEVWAVFESREDTLFKIMDKEGLYTHALFVDISDENACANIVAELAQREATVDGVFSPYEMMQTLVGEVAEALELPGNSYEAYKIARSKHLSRLATAKAGLATPRSGVARSTEEMAGVVGQVGFPCIIKPSSGAGSCGVLRANTVEEAEAAYETIQEDLRKPENGMLAYNPGCETGVIVEQLLEGDEFDVDMLMWDGEMVYGQTVFNWPPIAPYYLETGTAMPSGFPRETDEAIQQYALGCVRAMGFRQGCFHVEVMLTAEGPVLIEVNARQGGGPNQTFNLDMCGVDMFANFFMAAFNIPINPPRHEATFAMSDYAITSPFTGVLKDNSHMDHIRAHPNVQHVQDLIKPGGKVTGLDTGFPQWTNVFLVKAETPARCTEIVNSLIDGLSEKMNIVAEDTVDKAASPDAPQEDGQAPEVSDEEQPDLVSEQQQQQQQQPLEAEVTLVDTVPVLASE